MDDRRRRDEGEELTTDDGRRRDERRRTKAGDVDRPLGSWRATIPTIPLSQRFACAIRRLCSPGGVGSGGGEGRTAVRPYGARGGHGQIPACPCAGASTALDPRISGTAGIAKWILGEIGGLTQRWSGGILSLFTS